MKNIFFTVILLSSLSLLGSIPIKDGEKVAFLGDSITELGGWTWPYTGFIHLVQDGLKEKGVKITTIRAGKSGHHTRQMLARQQRDVLNKKPQWMFLSSGGNDIAFKISLEEFKKNIAKMVENAQKAGIKVVLMTSLDAENSKKRNARLVPYNAFIRSFAAEKKIHFIDLNKTFQAALKSPEFASIKPPRLSYDGIHLNGFGHIVAAKAILRACGLPEAKLPALEKKWTSSKRNALEVFLPVTSREQIAIHNAAKAGKMSVEAYIKTILPKD